MTTAVQTSGTSTISADEALRIAQADALRAYRDLSAFRIQIRLESDGWHVDYDLKDPRLKGGGPHYVIDSINGTLIQKRYDQ